MDDFLKGSELGKQVSVGVGSPRASRGLSHSYRVWPPLGTVPETQMGGSHPPRPPCATIWSRDD